MKWYLKVLKQYADFSGRARRTEYWMFFLYNFIFSFVLGRIDVIIGTYEPDIGLGVLGGLYSLFVLIPGLAVAVRRLHDVGKSGWMLLVSLIPIIGVIWLFILLVTDSEPGENQYGVNPKESVESFYE